MWAHIRRLVTNPTVQGVIITIAFALLEALVKSGDDPQRGRQ